MKRIMLLAVLVVFGFGSLAMAADFEKEFAKALINIPPDASNASMGNAWVATPLFGSNSAAVTAMGTFDQGGVSLNYGFIDFDKGPDVQFWSPSAAIKLPIGVMQVSYSKGESKEKVFQEEYYSQGGYSDSIEFDSVSEIDLQYGFGIAKNLIFINDRLYLGAGYNYGESDIRLESVVGTPATTLFSSLKSKSRVHSWSLSAAYQPNPKISLGAFYSHSWDKGDDKTFFEGELIEKDSYKSQSNQYRFGIGLQVTSSTFVAVDYQHLDLSSGNSDQIFAGIEQAIVGDWLYLYAGWAGDGPTGGIGAYFKNGGINLAYMHDTNDGLDETLGKTRIGMIAGYWNF